MLKNFRNGPLGLTLVGTSNPELVGYLRGQLFKKPYTLHPSTVLRQSTIYPGAQWDTATPQEVGMDPVKFNEAMAYRAARAPVSTRHR
jgi:hypothetical protein